MYERELKIYNTLIKWKYISIFLMIVIIIAVIVVAVKPTNTLEVEEAVQGQKENIIPDRFQIIDEQYVGPEMLNTKAYIVYDEETLLEYIIVCKPNSIDIELLYDTEGKPLHYDNVVSIYN